MEINTVMEDNPNLDRLPPKPTKPLDSECCGNGCSPCVLDIYEKQLKKWESQCENLQNGECHPNQTNSSSHFLVPEHYGDVEITEVIPETSTMRIYRFSWKDSPNSTLDVQIGQHVLIRQNGISRQYTVLRVNKGSKTFDILIKIYEQVPDALMLTPTLEDLLPGQTLEMRGPFGSIFDYRPNQLSNIFLISAGTGIAPMYRIIEKVLDDETDETRLKLLYACHSLEDFPLLSTFKKWSSHWNFEVIYFTSAQIENESLPYYGMKVINHRLDFDHLKSQISRNGIIIDSSSFIVCGTKSFEKDMINHLFKLNVDTNKIVLF